MLKHSVCLCILTFLLRFISAAGAPYNVLGKPVGFVAPPRKYDCVVNDEEAFTTEFSAGQVASVAILLSTDMYLHFFILLTRNQREIYVAVQGPGDGYGKRLTIVEEKLTTKLVKVVLVVKPISTEPGTEVDHTMNYSVLFEMSINQDIVASSDDIIKYIPTKQPTSIRFRFFRFYGFLVLPANSSIDEEFKLQRQGEEVHFPPEYKMDPFFLANVNVKECQSILIGTKQHFITNMSSLPVILLDLFYKFEALNIEHHLIIFGFGSFISVYSSSTGSDPEISRTKLTVEQYRLFLMRLDLSNSGVKVDIRAEHNDTHHSIIFKKELKIDVASVTASTYSDIMKVRLNDPMDAFVTGFKLRE